MAITQPECTMKEDVAPQAGTVERVQVHAEPQPTNSSQGFKCWRDRCAMRHMLLALF